VQEVRLTDKTFRRIIPALCLWLASWIVLSWAGVQDDAFIHLRYADNLLKTGLITYNGVNPDFGTSSLLYVYLLSALRALTLSPDLPRIVSSTAHILLFASIVLLLLSAPPLQSRQARLLSFIWLILLISPTAVRWLDDGMETSLALCLVALICWLTFRQSLWPAITGIQYLAYALVGFLSVLLRIELILVCVLAFAILGWRGVFESKQAAYPYLRLKAVAKGSHLLLGGALALAIVRVKMHFLLPDTALAKSSGEAAWNGTFFVTAKILVGAISFGAGMFLFWLLTIFLLMLSRRFRSSTLFANLVFPILFALAALRGQEVQGARYFVWTFCFSILWNILELGRDPSHTETKKTAQVLIYSFLILVLFTLPYESVTLYPMLKSRSALLRQFESDHLDRFAGKRGVAVDVGLIGYFSQADICDLAGLVNGREKAQETKSQRAQSCAAAHPDFLFLDAGQTGGIRPFLPLNEWSICQHFDFRNVKTSDRHYLFVPRANALETCKQVSNSLPSNSDGLTDNN